jgi:lipoyl(octanoyl) transferase
MANGAAIISRRWSRSRRGRQRFFYLSPRPTLQTQWRGRIDYATGLALQAELADQRRAGQICDTLLLLEHEPVYTIGRTPDKSSLQPADAPAATLPHPVVEISRGGQATYHGPGQLVGYFIIDLAHFGRDLHVFLRWIEAQLIALCAHYGVAAHTPDGLTGVWVGEKKIASIGIGARHWITQHGFALNVNHESLSGFRSITPCGLTGVSMTCLDEARAPTTEASELNLAEFATQAGHFFAQAWEK